MLTNVSRARAFGVHFSISLVIFMVLVGLMVFSWFPGPFFASDGGWQGIRIIAAVDIVLGPMLTLIFFSPRKKSNRELLIDLVAIAAVQLAALTWGTWTVYNQRTVAVAFSGSQFFSISHGALSEANEVLRGAGIEIKDPRKLSDAHPAQIYVTPIEPDKLGKYLADIFNGLPEIQLRTDRYRPLQEHWQDVLPKAVDLASFSADIPDLARQVLQLETTDRALVFFRLKLRFGNAVAGYDADTLALRRILTFERPPQRKADG